jgi:hypothetical protein
MLIKYFLTGLRNIRRHLGYTLIIVLGLALGIASCLLIFLVVRYELGYDAFNKKADRIYRVNHHSIDYNPRVSPVVAQPCNIMGVVRDFQSESKHKKRRACIMLYNQDAFWSVSARLRMKE